MLCTIGSLVALLAALFGRDTSRSAKLSALLGTIGSAAWAMAAYQDSLEEPLTV